MALLTATEKLKILVSGKATLKELNDLEKQAETEAKDDPKDEPKDNPKDDPKDEPKDNPKDDPKDEPKDSVSIEEYNKLLAKIDEMDAMLKEAQEENVNGNSGGNEPSFDEQLNNMFKDVRF